MLRLNRPKGLALAVALAVVLSLHSIVSVPVRAQVAGATLSGTVTDSSGAIIPNAKISLKNIATGVTRDVSTDGDGFYSAPNLLPGTYTVTISADGFATRVETGLALTVGATQLLNVSLHVGQVGEKVEVVGSAPTVQLFSSTLSAEVNSTTVRELPLNGRDWTTLATLQPGVSATRTQSSVNSTNSRGNRGFGNELTDSGHRSTENNYRMNGISINDYTNGAPGSTLGVNLGVDAIAEFSVLTSNYSAEYGRTSGAVINAISKSGTDSFHGSAFWFLRDQEFDARNFFDPPQIPPFRRNQFGASAGGPIRKGKTFIFGSYEGIRQSLSNTFRDSVPSADARNGILHNADGSTTTIAVDPGVAPFLPLWPMPNSGLIGTGNTGFFVTAGVSKGTENYVTTRVDQKFSEKDSLAGSYFFDNSPVTTTDALVDVLTEVAVRRQMGSIEETHIFSPTLLNAFRVGVSRFVGLLNNPLEALNPLSNDPSLGSIPGRFAAILTVPGLTTMQGGFGSASVTTHAWTSGQLYDDAFLTKGLHSIKFGFAFERMRENTLSRVFQNGTFTFPSLQGFLLNTPTSVQLLNPSIGSELGIRQSLFGGYVQDDWRIRPHLTINLGLRYEMTTLPTEAHDQYQFYADFYGGTPVPQHTAFQTNPTTKNFEPRVGFSWDPFKDGKTAVRGGFGIFDVLPLPYSFDGSTASGYPFNVQSSATLTGQPAGSTFPTGALGLIGFDPSNLKAINTKYIEQNPHRNYVMSWDLNVQRDIAWGSSFMVGYVGSHTLHQAMATNDSNGVGAELTSAGYLWPFPVGSGARLNPNLGQIHALFWDDSASYNGFQAEFRKRLGHGVQAQAAYTWSKCIDSGTGGSYPDFFLNSLASITFFAKDARRGNCDFDLRHNLIANFIWMLPTPKFGGAVGRQILGGWEMGGVVTVSSGTPFSVLIAGDPLGQNNSGRMDFPSRTDAPGCDNPTNPGNVNAYLNLSCFTPPTAPASFSAMCKPAAASVAAIIPDTCMNLLGNVGRNHLFGPGFANLDFSLFKNFHVHKISDTFSAQLRFEFFNILNHPNFQSPIDNATLFNQDGTSVAGAGAIDATSNTSRQIQFGLKIIW